ncbi:hypothetical protein ANA_C12264 [Anabaena sp. 90]|nr:hypothetical protein ANA_C12264 [Anabaena sp. 90]
MNPILSNFSVTVDNSLLPKPCLYQLPMTNYQLPITNHQSPITNHQLPITNDQLPITNYQSN